MTRKFIYSIFFLLLLTDTGYSFLQHYGQPLDGDMPGLIVPSEKIYPVLSSPFGLRAVLKHETYINPNRFFCHWSLREYFLNMPGLLQKIKNPVSSVYLSCAVAKTSIQLALIILLAMLISGTTNVLKMDYIVSALLIAPLFQTNGFRGNMGIIDPSITYTFFLCLTFCIPAALSLPLYTEIL